MQEDTAFKNAIRIDRKVAADHKALMSFMHDCWDTNDHQAAANEAI